MRQVSDESFLANVKNFHFTEIHINSKNVTNNSLFVALKGANYDAHQFIDEAIQKGASIIAINEYNTNLLNKYKNIKFIICSDTRRFLPKITNIFYNQRPENIIAVTGTNGKTSVVSFFRQLLSCLGKKTITIGTNGIEGIQDNQKTINTTPDPITIAKALTKASQSNYQYAAIEATSHGIEHFRINDIPIKAAGFTNITQDHMDSYKSIEQYLMAKKKLFSEILQDKSIAVINNDSNYIEEIKKTCLQKKHEIITYGKNGDISLINLTTNPNWTQVITINVFGKQYKLQLKMPGIFQAHNLMCAIGLIYASNINLNDIMQYVEKLENPNGRMKVIPYNQNTIIIDYAHNPDGIQKVIETAKAHKPQSRLIAIFGAGGSRDAAKRPLMGAIASKNCDLAIITDDNPRTEDPSKIRQEIIAGALKKNTIEIGNRSDAIKKGLSIIKDDDILLILGRGDDTDQLINGRNVNIGSDEQLLFEHIKNKYHN